MNKILILGASGFIGKILYKELQAYFDVYGTYYASNSEYKKNKVMYRFDVEKDEVTKLLNKVKPNYIISSLRGNFKSQIKVHKDIFNYTLAALNCKVLYLSTVNVFDAKGQFPSYENDTLLAKSDYGKFKISVEKLIQKLPESKHNIIRLPLVLGVNSPSIIKLKETAKNKVAFEVYPNLIISTTTADKIAQQIHYIINKKKTGTFHLASNDVIHHNELFDEISEKLALTTVIFKNIFTSNKENYLAILSKENQLPRNYRITVSQVIEDCTLNEEIDSLRL